MNSYTITQIWFTPLHCYMIQNTDKEGYIGILVTAYIILSVGIVIAYYLDRKRRGGQNQRKLNFT